MTPHADFSSELLYHKYQDLKTNKFKSLMKGKKDRRKTEILTREKKIT